MIIGIALGVAALGGYVAAGLTTHVQTTTVAAPVSRPATLPDYIIQEISPAPAPRLRQDNPEFIATYAAENPPLNYGVYQSLPDWVKREITHQQAARLSQDSPEFISQYASP